MEDNLWWKTTLDGRRPLMATFVGRRPLTEDDLWWKTTFDRRQPSTEDDLWRKTTFDGRRPLMEDNLGQKMTSDKDDLRRKTTFNVRQPLIGCIVYYQKQMFMTPHLDSYSTTDSKAGVLSAVMHHALCIMGHASYKHIYLKHFLGVASLVEAVGF